MVSGSQAANTSSADGGSKTDRLLAGLRRSPIFRQLIPMEAGIGWPIPSRRNGRVYLTLPFFGFGIGASKGQRIDLRPPFAAITLDWSSGRPVKYVSFAFESPWPAPATSDAVGSFPHPAVAALSVARYKELRAELFEHYDELCESLAGNVAFPASRAARFSELLQILVEPSLMPYYRALGTKFFERFAPEAPQR